MGRRGLVSAALALPFIDALAMAEDRVMAPPGVEVMTSPGGVFSFEIAVDRPPGTPLGAARATGTLRRGEAVAWRRALSQPVRPRFALVDDAGHVALIGRWENTPADIAIELLGEGGAAVATLDRAAIERAAGVDARAMVAAARHGAWLDRVPVLRGGMAVLGTAGRVLKLDMATGALRRLRD